MAGIAVLAVRSGLGHLCQPLTQEAGTAVRTLLRKSCMTWLSGLN